MLVEINGAGFKNKGAQLMLETVAETLAIRAPAIQCFLTAGRERPPKDVGKFGLGMIWPSKILTSRLGKSSAFVVAHELATKLVPYRLLEPYGLATRHQMDALIDISGYAFGDSWGIGPITKMTRLANFYRKQGKPVVLMPQMLGPFEKPGMKEAFVSLSKATDIIFARDKISYSIATEASPEANILLSPDITIASNGLGKTLADATPAHKVDSEVASKRVCFIPNVRVLKPGPSQWAEEAYLGFFQSCHERISSSGLEPVIVVHDTIGQDMEIAIKLQQRIGESSIAIHTDPDPKGLKRFIGSSRFAVGSRFHSLVAALSSGVPVIAVGWSHKYGQLLADFEQKEFDIDHPNQAENIVGMLDQLLSEREYLIERDKIAFAGQSLLQRCNATWQKVLELLERSPEFDHHGS